MVTLITVAGTWGEKHPEAWFRWGSPWWNEAERRGAQRADVDRKRWSGEIEGIFGENKSWGEGASDLLRYIMSSCLPSDAVVVAHSHGGQVAALALDALEGFKGLITLGTPVRMDMRLVYRELRVRNWSHIYSRSDWWQLFGGIGDGSISFRRKMKHANRNIRAKGMSHADLHSVEAWNKHGWWDLIFGEEA
jgi:pimeloyl-ACP methyl ester carboxylesterase